MMPNIRRLCIAVWLFVPAACSSGGGAATPPRYVPPANNAGLTATPGSIAFTTTPATQSLIVSESGYAGAFNATQSCTPTAGSGAVATLTPATATPAQTGGPVSFIVSAGTASGSCTVNVADGAGHQVTVGVTAGFAAIAPIRASSTALALTLADPAATFSITEPNYGGGTNQFFRAQTTCTPAGSALVTTSAYAAAAGAPATFEVTAIAPGSCTVAVTDQFGQSATIAIAIARALAIAPSTIVFTTASAQTVAASETGIVAFSLASTTCGAFATIAAAGAASFTVTPTPAGSALGADCTATFSDNSGGTGTLHILINSLSIGVQ